MNKYMFDKWLYRERVIVRGGEGGEDYNYSIKL